MPAGCVQRCEWIVLTAIMSLAWCEAARRGLHRRCESRLADAASDCPCCSPITPQTAHRTHCWPRSANLLAPVLPRQHAVCCGLVGSVGAHWPPPPAQGRLPAGCCVPGPVAAGGRLHLGRAGRVQRPGRQAGPAAAAAAAHPHPQAHRAGAARPEHLECRGPHPGQQQPLVPDAQGQRAGRDDARHGACLCACAAGHAAPAGCLQCSGLL